MTDEKTITGGSFGNPTAVVTAFCDALRDFNFENTVTCMQNGSADLENLPTGEQLAEGFGSEYFFDFFRDSASQMTYRLEETENDGENSAVAVSFTHVDASELMHASQKEFALQALAMAFSEDSESKIAQGLAEVFKKNAEAIATATDVTDVIFHCVNGDDGWKIAPFDSEAENAIITIIAAATTKEIEDDTSFEDLFGSGDGTGSFEGDFDSMSEDAPPEITNWTDVPPGDTAKLGTLKIRIDGCEEKHDLPSMFGDPKTAEEGTKFLVLSATLENITDEEIIFNNEYSLTDSNGNSYEPFSEISMLEYDETFWFASLEPNVPKSGVLIYNVAEDTDGCFMCAVDNAAGVEFRFHVK